MNEHISLDPGCTVHTPHSMNASHVRPNQSSTVCRSRNWIRRLLTRLELLQQWIDLHTWGIRRSRRAYLYERPSPRQIKWKKYGEVDEAGDLRRPRSLARLKDYRINPLSQERDARGQQSLKMAIIASAGRCIGAIHRSFTFQSSKSIILIFLSNP